MKYTFYTLAIIAILHANAFAAVKYWDVNGATAGASAGTTATGAWDTATTANWSADSTGASATTTWAAADTAIFAAGTNATGAYTVTASGTPSAAGITFEEGTITLAGTAVAVNTGVVTLKTGTRLITASSGGGTGTGITFTAGGSYAITGDAALQTTNAAANGSFVSSLATIALSNNANLTIDYQVTNTLNIIQTATVISGNGNLIKTGGGVIAIASPSTYTGSTTINGGELRIRTGPNSLPTTTDVTVNTGGILNLNGVSQSIASLAGNGDVGTGSGTLTLNGSSNTVLNGALKNIANAGASGVTTGNGKLVRSGSGTITFNGVNDIAGTITLTSGGITVGSTGSLCGAICDVVVNGGVLNLNNTAQTIENLTGTGGTINLGTGHTLTTTAAGSGTYSGTIAGAGGLTKTDANNLTLSGPNTYDGVTAITGTGTISVGSATALGSTVGKTTVASGALLNFQSGTTLAVNEPIEIAGTGNGVSSSGGAIFVQTANTNITIGSTVTLTGDAGVGVSSAALASVNFSNPTAFTFTGGTGKNLTLNGASGTGTKKITGAIALGTGSVTKAQSGTWVLSGSNSYSGATSINAGALSVSNVGNSGSSSNLGTNGTINIGATTTPGTLAYTGTGETSDKVINLAGTTGGAVIDQSGTGNLKFTSDLTAGGNGAKTLTLQGSTAGTGEIAGNIVDSTGATSLAKSGTGTWVLSGTSVYSGTTAVSGGTLLVNGSTTGTGAVSVTSATLGGTGSVAGAVTAGTGGNVSPGTSVGAIGALAIGALTFNTGSSFVYDLNSDSATGDLLNANGALNLPASGATLSLADAGTTVLTGGTKLTLISYAGAWNGNIFDTFADDSTFTLGVNTFTIDYNDPNGNLSGNLNGGSFTNYVTLTAVPEANAFWLGGAICLVLGLTVGTRKMIGVRTAA